ncbi:hypothetical protein [Clostridium sp. DJ247]|uniref:hypothetical protein n=1 Tax=Clostridium sp. DJ247 TaxID=2726188 RepID=UPI001627FD98|nr:hypothetical protein [Clostridium sp. DJ247]MBC2579979.1 hypothetical protein [Clostridium sp. DJ247]
MDLENMYRNVFNNVLKNTLEECYIEGLNKYLYKKGYGEFSIALGKNPTIPVDIKFEDIQDKLLELFMNMDNKNDDSYYNENKSNEIVKFFIKEYLNNLIINARRKFK